MVGMAEDARDIVAGYAHALLSTSRPRRGLRAHALLSGALALRLAMPGRHRSFMGAARSRTTSPTSMRRRKTLRHDNLPATSPTEPSPQTHCLAPGRHWNGRRAFGPPEMRHTPAPQRVWRANGRIPRATLSARRTQRRRRPSCDAKRWTPQPRSSEPAPSSRRRLRAWGGLPRPSMKRWRGPRTRRRKEPSRQSCRHTAEPGPAGPSESKR